MKALKANVKNQGTDKRICRQSKRSVYAYAPLLFSIFIQQKTHGRELSTLLACVLMAER